MSKKQIRLNEDIANIIASEYWTNGKDMAGALQKAGYSKSYANTGASKRVSESVLVTNAINKLRCQNTLDNNYTRELHNSKLDKLLLALEDKIAEGNVQAIRTATQILSEQAASNGLHTQTINTDSEQVAEIDENKKFEAKRLAVLRLQDIV